MIPQTAIDMQLPLAVRASNFVYDGVSYERGTEFPYQALGIPVHKVEGLLQSQHLMVKQSKIEESLTIAQVDALTYKEIQPILKQKGINAKGSTEELRQRLKESLAN